MSWGFGPLYGKKEAVIMKMAEFRSHPHDADQTQIEAAKALIKAELDRLAPGTPVTVKAFGHHYGSQERNVGIEVRSLAAHEFIE